MKRILLTLCLIGFLMTNLLSQENAIKVDSGYINVDGGKLFYEMAGRGDNIVLLHDGMLDREVWDNQFPLLAMNYRVVRYDRRTYGKSSDPLAPFSDIEDLNQIFIQLNIDKAIVFGMSAGGGLAIDFTLKYPGRVSALILVGAVVNGFYYSPHMMNRGGHLKNPADLSDPQKAIKYFAWDDPYEIYSENVSAKEKFVKILESSQHKSTGNFYIPADRPGANFLSEIKIPVLILVGEYDIPDVHAHSGVIQFGIPKSRREIILNSGHLIPLEQPEAFNRTVFNFLNRMFFNILYSQGMDAAIQYLNIKKAGNPDVKLFNEGEMNAWGYRFLQEGKIKDAVELFKLNVQAYPGSANAFDSLAEAYLKDGQKDMAIKNYEKSLELNPGNDNARKALTELKGGNR